MMVMAEYPDYYHCFYFIKVDMMLENMYLLRNKSMSQRIFYYEALQESSIGWHTNENSYFEYMKNFLSMLYKCYKELDKRFSTVNGKNLKNRKS